MQWSYIHRRQIDNQQLHFDKTATEYEDIENFCQNVIAVENVKKSCNVIHSTIPYRYLKRLNLLYNMLKKFLPGNIKFIESVTQIDFARDGHHYDILTSQVYVDRYLKYLV